VADGEGMDELPYLDYESLDVYRCAIEFVELAARIGAALPRGESERKDQLKRASISIPLNIAESSGKPAGSDRSRFLMIARASALECGAVLDVGVALAVIDSADAASGRSLLTRIVAMLTKMSR